VLEPGEPDSGGEEATEVTEDLPAPGSRPAAAGTLRGDCARCVGLCCVAPAFAASSDFALNKPAGQPCPHLGSDFGCTIHAQLRDRGFPGCTVYDCFGAGQKVVQATFGGQDWRAEGEIAGRMFDAFAVMRQLHELLWYLSAALDIPTARGLAGPLRQAFEETDRLTERSADELAELDVPDHRARVNALLRQVSALARAGRRRALNRSGADLMGKDLRRSDLRSADLRGAYLIGADLRGLDLSHADVIGADLRGADVRGADLSRCLFLTQVQVSSARGDLTTKLPGTLDRPPHWLG
jgi:uncharacterized protein YjbI with pentapeptide repeats